MRTPRQRVSLLKRISASLFSRSDNKLSESKRTVSRAPTYRSLETRIVFDGAAAAVVADGVADHAPNAADAADAAEASHADVALQNLAAHAADQRVEDTSSIDARHEIAFIDASVADISSLIQGLDPSVEVVLLDANRDGVEQMAEALAGRTDIDAIHIISHGREGVLQLGTATLDAGSMTGEHADDLAIIRDALSDEADILVYGCNFGEGAAGQEAVDLLADLTGADIAASDDATGAADLGADWDLEISHGDLEAKLSVSYEVQQDWHYTLTTASGGESAVNSSTTGTQAMNHQSGRQIASDSSGNYIVVWEDSSSGSSEVFARLFNADGTARGSAFQVNSTTSGTQAAAAVAMDASGNFVVTWASNAGSGGDASGNGVFAQRYNSSGVAQGSEFLVNSGYTTGDQDEAAISMTTSGFVITWTSNGADGGGNGVYAQRYDSTGAAQGSNFRINSTTSNDQESSNVVMTSSGAFIVTWSSNVQDGSSFGTYARMFDSSGTATTAEFRVNTTTSNDQRYSSIARDSSGNFVITWSSSSQDGSGWGIYGQRYNASGVAQGSEFRVNTTTSSDQSLSNVAMASDGRFIVTWKSASQDGSSSGVYAQEYDSGGSAVGTEFRVNTTTANDQDIPDVTWNNEKATIAWSGNGTGDTAGVFTQRYTTNETPSAETVTATTSGGLQINASGNDGYMRADDGSAIFGGKTQITLEVRFSMSSSAATENPLISYAVDGTSDNEVYLRVMPSGRVTMGINATAQTTAAAYTQLLDGSTHTLTATWNSTGGTAVIYIDGVAVETFTGIKSGYTIASGGTLVLGQDQDAENANFNSGQVFSGTLYDVRVYGDIRTGTEVANNYASDVAWNDNNLLANWKFNDFSTGSVVVDTVSGNNLTVAHATGTGFTTGTVELSLGVAENATNGTTVGTVTGTDAERTAKINAVLAADSTLRYSAETNQFYRYVNANLSWTAAEAAARNGTGTSLLSGVTGQLVTIRSAAENEVIWNLAQSYSKDLWIAASDNAAEGTWRWYEGGSASTQFWSGASGGSAVNGEYSNFLSGEPNDWSGIEEYAHIFAASGKWNDQTASASGSYVVEWNADDVLDATHALTYSITSQSVSGAFTINSDTGAITVADGTKLNYESATSQNVTVRITDAQGATYDKVFTINLSNVYEAPVITSNGAGSTASVSVAENQTAVTTVTSQLDASKSTVTYSIVGGADQAKFTINSSTGELTFVSAPNFESPTDSGGNNIYDVTVQASDGTSSDTQAIAVTVTNVNDIPVATTDTFTTTEDTQSTFDVRTNDTDQDGNALTVTHINGSAISTGGSVAVTGGSVTLNVGGTLTFTPTANYNGSPSFTYTVSDGNGGSETGTVNGTVTAVNDAPVVTLLSGDSLAYTEGDGAVLIDQGGDALVTDVDGGAFTSGTLTVSFTAGSTSAEDILGIRNQGTGAGQIGLSGNNVTYGGTVIGTVTGGANGSNLVITFNSSSSAAAAQALIRNITYRDADTDSPAAGARTVRFALTDGAGGSSGNLDTTVTVSGVNDGPTFSAGDGKVTTNISGTTMDQVNAVAVQPDGKIVAVGFNVNGTDRDFVVVRYNADGSLDTTFGGGDGIVTTSMSSSTDEGRSVKILPDGSILVAGATYTGSSYEISLVRYTSDGSLDPAFGGGDGISTTSLPGWEEGYGVDVSSNGTIFVSGISGNDFMVAKFLADGSLDTSFGSSGIVSTDFAAGTDRGYSVVVQPDGKIVVGGLASNGTSLDFALARYTSTGALDTTFGSGTGKVLTNFGGLSVEYGYNVTLQPDGKILMVGWSDVNASGNNDVAIARYNSDGSLDGTFGTSGKATVSLSSGSDLGMAVTVQSDGKILIAAQSSNNGGNMGLIRLTSAGAVDTTFGGGDGIVDTDFASSGTDRAYAITVQADGKIIIAGSAVIAGNIDFGIARYDSVGNLDVMFDTQSNTLGGTVSYTENGAGVVLDSDVSIFDAELGAADNYNGSTLTLSRNGGANAEDAFVGLGALSTLTEGGNLIVSGTTIGTVTTNSGGQLVLTFNGNATQSLINSALRAIGYRNTSDAPTSSVQIDWVFSDGNSSAQGSGGALTASGTTTVNITAVNDAPVNTVGSGWTTNEDTSVQLTGLAIADVDAASGTMTVTLSVPSGTLTATSGGSVTLGGSGSGTITLTGTVANINAYLASGSAPTYVPVANANGAITLTMTTSDGGNTGTGGTLTDTDNATITVSAVNDAPVNTAGSGWTTNEDTSVQLTGLAIADVDASSGSMTVTLSVPSGTLTATSGSSVTIGGSGSGTITLSGTLANINAYLASGSAPTYVPVSDANGAITLTMTTSDGGNTGTGGTLTNIDTATITVTAVNDAPTASADSFTTSEDSPTTFDVRANDSDTEGAALSVTHVNGSAISTTTRVLVTGGSVILDGSGNIVFTPRLGYSGATSFTYTVSDGAGGSVTATVNGTVTAVVDTPVLSHTTGSNLIQNGSFETFTGGTYAGWGYADVTSINGWTASFDGAGAIEVVEFASDGTYSIDMDGAGPSSNMTLSQIVSGVSTGDTYVLSFNVGAWDGASSVLQVYWGGALLGTISQTSGYDQFDFTVTGGSGNGTNEVKFVEIGSANGIGAKLDNVRLYEAGPATATGNEDSAIAIPLAVGLSDTDGSESLVVTVSSIPVGATLSDGTNSFTATLGSTTADVSTWTRASLTLTPPSDYHGAVAMTVTATSTEASTGATASDTRAINIIVTSVNDGPVASGDSFTTNEDTPSTFDVRTNDSDVESDALTVTHIDGNAIATGGSVAVTGGSVTLNANGTLTFTPTANYNGTPSFTYTVSDGNGGSSTATVNGTVAAVNDGPVASADSFTTNEDTPSTFDVRNNDTDVESDALTVTHIDGSAISTGGSVAVTGGSVTLNANGTLTFTPTANYNGTPSFAYTVSDGNGGSSTATVNGTVTAVNDGPVASGDSFTTNEDTPATFDVRTNDSDVESDALSVTHIDGNAISTGGSVAVTGGSVTLNGNGTLTFTPTSNYNGTPSFTYTVSDGNGGSSTATVNGTVTAVNDGPVASADSFTTNEDTPTTFDVRTNDSDVENDALTVTHIDGNAIVTGGSVAVTGGSVTLNANGTLTFTPTANYNGTPSFAYTVSDGNGGSSTATVNGTVTAVNDGPVASGDSFTTNEDTPTTFDVGTNDSDVEGDALTVTHIDGNAISTGGSVAVTGGSVTLNGNGTLTFTPTANYNGTPSFTYTVSDGNGGSSTATVNGTVTAVNDGPVASGDSFTTNEDTPTSFDVRTNDSDVENDALTVTHIDGNAIATGGSVAVTGGSVTLNANGTLTFTPSANYNGSPSFTYTVSDGNGGSSTATVSGTVTAVNDGPVASTDTFTTNEDTPTSFDVRTNDSDIESDALTVTHIDGNAISTGGSVSVTGGSVTLNANGTLTFTPTANYNGTPSFTYTVSDGNGGSSTATVNGTVTAVNDGPVASTDTFTTNEDTPTTFDVRTNDSDVESDALTVTHIDGNAIATGGSAAVTGGSVTLNANGTLTFTPSANYNGSPSFTCTVSDGNGGSSTATVNGTVTAVNDGPVASADSFTTNEDTPATVDVRTNDSDVESDALTVTHINGSAISSGGSVAVTGGSVTLNANGTLTFTPTANYNGTPSFTYTVSDGNGGSSTATVNGTVTAVNDGPVALADSFTTNEDTPTTFDVRTNDSDVESDALTVTHIDGNAIVTGGSLAVTGGSVTLNANGTLTFTPTTNYNGTPSFTYTVSDGNGGSSTATVNGTVSGDNDAPIVAGDSFTTSEDTPTTFDVRTNDSDNDGDALTVTHIDGNAISTGGSVAVTGGSVTLNANGTLTFTPTTNYNGTPSFTYTVTDGNGGSSTATVNGTVSGDNDAPVVAGDSFITNEDTPTSFDVRGNDSDNDGDALTVTHIDGNAIVIGGSVSVTGGSVTLNANGTLTFTPTANYNGSPSFTYTVSDGNGGSSTATVNGTVTAVNDGPVASTDSFTTNEDTPTTFDVRGNDSDTDGNALTVTRINGTSIATGGSVAVTGGSVTLNANGTLTFTPTTNYNGTPSFTYTVSDGHGGTTTATVNGTVTAVNDAATGGVSIDRAGPDGRTLTADTSSLADADGIGTLRYVWMRDGVAIDGATASTYRATADDDGHTITVAVSFTDGDGANEQKTATGVAIAEQPPQKDPVTVPVSDETQDADDEDDDDLGTGAVDQRGTQHFIRDTVVAIGGNSAAQIESELPITATVAWAAALDVPLDIESTVLTEALGLNRHAPTAFSSLAELLDPQRTLPTPQADITIDSDRNTILFLDLHQLAMPRGAAALTAHDAPGTNALTDYTVTLADGSALPDWLSRPERSIVSGVVPEGVKTIDLAITIRHADGAIEETTISVDVATGEVVRAAEPNAPQAPLFSDQLEDDFAQ